MKARVAEGRALYELDEELLAEVAPDLIVTQAICDVCAVSFEDVLEVAARLPGKPRVLQQDPSTLGEMLEDVIRLGEATEIAEQAHELRGELEGRLATVRAAVGGASLPRVIALEWLDPPYVGGHWIPEMISIAGGEDVAGPPGLKSPEVSWGELSGLNPDVAIAMPCGWQVEDSRAQALAYWDRIASSARGGYSPSTPPRPSRGPARAWSTGSSCSATCSIPTSSTRRATSASPRCARQPAAGSTSRLRWSVQNLKKEPPIFGSSELRLRLNGEREERRG